MRLECGNLDSCEPGTTHEFPNVGTRVRFREEVWAKVVGQDENIFVALRSGTVATDEMTEAHQVAVFVAGYLVWADIEDDFDVVGAQHDHDPGTDWGPADLTSALATGIIAGE